MIELLLLLLLLVAVLGLLLRFPVPVLLLVFLVWVAMSSGCASDPRTSEEKYRDLKAAEQAARREHWQLRRFRP